MSEDDKNPQSIDNLDGSLDASSETVGGSDQDTNEMRQALEAKTDECKGLNEKYLRLAAEFDNYKRLAQRDQREQIKFGNEQILKELLPVIDNLERAIKAARDNGGSEALIQGVELTLKQFVGVLAKFGVTPVDSVGRPFDPATQQAVAQVESD